jgi:hypothetical protein
LVKQEDMAMDHLTVIESILRNRGLFFSEIRDGKAVRQKIMAMLSSCFVFFGRIRGRDGGSP